jgi:hypothetical protein
LKNIKYVSEEDVSRYWIIPREKRYWMKEKTLDRSLWRIALVERHNTE